MSDPFANVAAGCYAVIFVSQRTADDAAGYAATAERMETLARGMPGFLGLESVRDEGGFGMTISYWRDEESIRAWSGHCEHLSAKQTGRERWYSRYELRVCKVERAFGFGRE